MALKLLVDEDTQAKYLVNLLVKAGHDVLTVNAAGLQGAADPQVLQAATKLDRVLLTRNCGDFIHLHETNPNHAGIIVIYQEHDPSKNMSYQDIVRAIAAMESATSPQPPTLHVLNHYR